MKLWACLGFAFLAIPALAEEPVLFFEQGTNYDFNDSTINYPAPMGSSRVYVKRPGVAGRLGFRITESLFIAADGRYSRPRLRDDSRDYGATVNSFNWAPVLGWQIPELRLQVWSAWIAGGSVSPDDFRNAWSWKPKGVGGWRMGAGIKVAKVSLNFEYQHLKYRDQDSLAFSALPNRSYVLSARFPIF